MFRFLIKYENLIISLVLIAVGSVLIFADIVGRWGISEGGMRAGIVLLVPGFYLFFHSLIELFPPSQGILQKERTPKALQTVRLRWHVLSPVKKALVIVVLMVGIPVLIFIVISGIVDILKLLLGMVFDFVVALI